MLDGLGVLHLPLEQKLFAHTLVREPYGKLLEGNHYGIWCKRCLMDMRPRKYSEARLAQSVERKALNFVVVGSSPTVGVALKN